MRGLPRNLLPGLGLAVALALALGLCAAAAAAPASSQPRQPAADTLLARAPPTAAPRSPAAMTADELILQFKRPELKAALLKATQGTPARQTVEHALQALGQRHGVSLRYVQTLGVGSALVAVAPASAQLDALVARLAADAEVESVEVNARMTHFRPGPR